MPGGYDASSGKFGKLVEVEVGTGNYEWNGRTWTEVKERQLRAKYGRKYYESVCRDAEITSRATTITRIDAILYNNHGIFGKIGQCSVNGSLVCRNEGIRYTTALNLNWDIRLYSGSNETVSNDKVGLAKSSDANPVTLWWMELPDGFVAMD